MLQGNSVVKQVSPQTPMAAKTQSKQTRYYIRRHFLRFTAPVPTLFNSRIVPSLRPPSHTTRPLPPRSVRPGGDQWQGG
eukprot:1178139-Prorocentrum_minimum.AAC.2